MTEKKFSTNNQGTDQEPSSSTHETTAANQEIGQEPSSSTPKTLDTTQEQNSKIPDKGIEGFEPISSNAKFQNPFGQQEVKQQDNKKEFSNPSFSKEGSKYSSRKTEELHNLLEKNKREITRQEKVDEDLSEKLDDLTEAMRDARGSVEEERRVQRRINRHKEEREKVRHELNKLNEDNNEIEQELSIKEANRENFIRNEYGTTTSDLFIENKNISSELLFSNNEPIKNTVLYVATFFPGLNPQDFKRVVSLLLIEQKTMVTIKKSIATEEGKLNLIEDEEERNLTEIWKESFDKPDQYLRICHLKVYRQNGKQVINFSLPQLREDFLSYFENEQPLYLEEQLRRTQELELLLDPSDGVADSAIDIAVKVAVDYPNTYAESWLLELLLKIAKEDEPRIKLLLQRLSILIYRLQIEPDYSKAQCIAQNFLEQLISPQYRNLAFLIVSNLIKQYLLLSGWQGIHLATQILTWLRQLIDQEGLEQQDEKIQQKYEGIQADTYNLLETLLWQSGFYFYIYNFITILSEWLPEQDIPPEKYSSSNIAALLLLFAYCEETTLKLDLKYYGYWPSVYPLFTTLEGDSRKIRENLDILISWLFHRSSREDLALQHALVIAGAKNINSLDQIGRFIAEWFAILCGFDDKDPNQEVLDLVDQLFNCIISKASRSQQKQLTEVWTVLTEEYLDKAVRYGESGNKKLKNQFVARRKLLRELKKRFKYLQKDNLAAK